jgi:hypothetical protein
MRLCEVIDLTTGPRHPEIKIPNMMDKTNWGGKKKLELRDIIVRDGKTGKIYGRRQIVQRA